jgi:hypothetical protein
MNEVASSHALDLALGAFGALFVLLTGLIGVIYHHNRKQHEDLKASVDWMREHHVSKETLDRVERTFRDAIDEMTESRRLMHKENQKGIAAIQESVTGVHRRIDEEFRFIRQQR